MQIPSYKDKGKAILDPIEEKNSENRAKRARIANNQNFEDQNANFPFKNNPIEAPLGIPFCLPSFCGPIRTGSSSSRTSSKSLKDQNVNFPNFDLNKDPVIVSSGPVTDFDLNKLPPLSPDERETRTGSDTDICTGTDLCVRTGEQSETESIKTKMERIARSKGLERVSDESAEVLSRGMDVFIKRIIGSVIRLNGSGKKGSADPIRMEDLYVMMQLNPHLLGERSREKLETIMSRCFKE